jgi:endonuclease G
MSRSKTSFLYRMSFYMVILFFAAGNAGVVYAAATQWPSQYLNGVAPDIRNAKLAEKTRELGYDNFVVMHSGVTLSPLWSAEHLTRENLLNAVKEPS